MTSKTKMLLAAVLLSGMAGHAHAANQPKNVPSIVMSKDCPKALEAYRHKAMRIYFAVAEDLSVCAYAYCTTGCQKSQARRLTAYRCEKESGVTCQVYDANDKVPEIEGY